jgi:hypothetical protein
MRNFEKHLAGKLASDVADWESNREVRMMKKARHVEELNQLTSTTVTSIHTPFFLQLFPRPESIRIR